MFHRRCGERVSLINGNRTAIRNFTEFNYGLVLSSEPLVENQLFEVRIDKKINSWSGSIEIGVTALDPETMEFPSSATDLRDGSWIMSGNSILKDGRTIVDVYGIDLDKLVEGDQIGVMRTTEDELMFYINGVCQGVAAENLPERVFAIIDLYGKCAQVSIVDSEVAPDSERSESEVEINNDRTMITSTTDLIANLNVNMNVEPLNHHPSLPAPASHDNQSRLQFHERCGSLVKLSCNNRTAERRRPLDEFNNGVVMTHRPLKNNELFEIRIDRLVDKWSGSIEVGITAHNPTTLEFPATMTNMRTGTTMMSGCGILTNGKGTRREYGEFNLDELREGDRIGMMRKSNGNLHYFINGLDQGVAATKVFGSVWGVVDLYGMTVKVTIVDRDEREEQNLITRRNTTLHQILHGLNDCPDEDFVDRLMFHPNCGTHAAVINNARTAHRPNAMDDFNNGVVLTNRPLKPNELFEVRLDKMVTKWAGSIEIGVTTHIPTKLEYPSTMTNVRSGTWMMTGNGVMHNGTTIIDEYGQNLDRLQVSDRVGVMRKESGTIHFFVNGTDQGAAAHNVPDKVYGVIDLYGQAAQATIVDSLDCYSPDTVNSSMSNTILYSDLRFHHVHGKNARVSNNGLTASRPRAFGEFNDAIVISNRALREGEMFDVVIEKMVDRWSGSIEAGVTAIRPEDLDFPGTMTDITHDTWMLSGAAVMQDGITLRDGYACDLDLLTANTRIGMMRHSDATLHFYIDGVDQGIACTGVPSHVYAVIDLYGQCAQVSIVPPSHAVQTMVSDASQAHSLPHAVAHSQPGTESVHRFSSCCGKNIALSSGNTVATRIRNYSQALLFSSVPLEPDEVFEVSIQERHMQWAGTLRIGVTGFQVNEHFPQNNLPPLLNCLTPETWFVSGNEVRKNGTTLKANYCPSLDWLVAGNRVGVKRGADGSLSFLLNGEDMGVAATNIPKRVFAVVDLYGSAVAVAVTSSRLAATPSASDPHAMAAMESSLRSSRLHDSLEMLLDTTPTQPIKILDVDSFSEHLEIKPWSDTHLDIDTTFVPQPTTSNYGGAEVECPQPALFEFHENHGRNVQLGDGRLTATRVASYNQGLAMSAKPLSRGLLFQVRMDSLNTHWVSSVMIGVTCLSPEKAHLPVTALGLKKQSWIISSDCVFHNGIKMKGSYGPNLDNLQAYNIVGVLVDSESRLHLFVNGVDQGVAAVDIPPVCYAVVDLYGCCEQVTLLNSPEEVNQTIAQASIMQTDNTSQICDDLATQLESESLSEKADSECHEKEKQSESCSESAFRAPRPFPTQSARALNQEIISTNALNEEIQANSRPSSQNQNHRPHQELQNLQLVNHELQNSNISQNQISRVTNQQNQLSRSLNQAMINSRSFNEGLQNSRTSDVLNSSSLILSSTFPNANTVLNTSIKQMSISNSNPNTPTQNSPTLAPSASTNHISLDSNTVDNAIVDSNTLTDVAEISNNLNMICNSNLPSNSVPISNDTNLTHNLNVISSESIDSNVPVISNKLTTSISNTQISNANNQVDSNTIPTSNDVSNAVPTISNVSYTNSEPNAPSISNTNVPNKSANVIFDESVPSANTITNLSIANKPPNSNIKSNEPVPNPTSNTLTNLSIANKPASSVLSNESRMLPISNTHTKPAATINVSDPHVIQPTSNTLTNLSIRSQHTSNHSSQNTLHLNVNAMSPVGVTSTPGITSAPSTPIVTSNCDYQAACTRFRQALGLPDGFFMYEPACHCDNCLKLRGSDLKLASAGWCRFPLRRLPGADQVPDKWHLAFYGTKLADIRRILDHGELLLPGELGLERSILGLHKDKSKEDVSDGTQLYFYPSLQCASIALPKKEEYIDPKTKKRYIAHAAFQILVQPGSYKVGPPSTDTQVDDSTEWVTKERGATALSALLVKLEVI